MRLQESSQSLAAAERSTGVPLVHRLVAGFIGLNAVFVAYFGLFKPALLDKKFTWAELPPLHARFVGALYLFGAIFLIGSMLCRRWADVAPTMVGTGIFTTSMIVLTLTNRAAFDFDLLPPVIWVIAYTVFPLMSWALVIANRSRSLAEEVGPPVPSWFTWALRAFTVVFAVAGLGLLLARSTAARAWPWKVSIGVAQFYGGPFLALAWVAWSYSQRRNLRSLRLYTTALAGLGVTVVAISLKHRALFDSADPAAWLWFATFGAMAVTSVAAAALAFTAKRTTQDRVTAPAVPSNGEQVPHPVV